MRYFIFATSWVLAASVTDAQTYPPGEPWPLHIIDNTSDGADGVKLGDINGDGLPDVVTGWEEGGVSRVYVHPGYEAVREPWPMVTVGITPDCEDAVFIDLDGDGMLDVLSSCEGQTRTMFVQWAPASVDDLLDPAAWVQQEIPAMAGMTQWMYATPIAGFSSPTAVVGSKTDDARVGLLRTTGGRDVENWTYQHLSDAGWIMSIKAVDMNGNGLLDVLMSDRRGENRGVRWLRNPGGDGTDEWQEFRVGDTDAEVMFLSLVDLDGDGLEDIVVAVRPDEIRWLRRLDESGERWETHVIPMPEGVGTAKAVAAGDMTGDGSLELVITCEHAHDDLHGAFGMRQDAEGAWQPFAIGGPLGIKYDRIELLDLTGNGMLDVLTCEENEGGTGLGVFWYENPWPPANR